MGLGCFVGVVRAFLVERVRRTRPFHEVKDDKLGTLTAAAGKPHLRQCKFHGTLSALVGLYSSS